MNTQDKIYEYIFVIDYDNIYANITSNKIFIDYDNNYNYTEYICDKTSFDINQIAINCPEDNTYVYENDTLTEDVKFIVNDNTELNEDELLINIINNNNIIALFLYTNNNKFDPSNQYKTVIELNDDLMYDELFKSKINLYIKQYIYDTGKVDELVDFIRQNFNESNKKLYIHLKFNKNMYFPKTYYGEDKNNFNQTIIEGIKYAITNLVIRIAINDDFQYNYIKNLLGYTEE